MKKILCSIAFWIIIFEIVIAAILFKLGFRVTYDPYLDNNWDAISAVAEWFGAIVGAGIIPIAVVFLQHKWDADKQDIAISNQEAIDALNRFREEYEPVLSAFVGGEVILNGGNASSNIVSNNDSTENKVLQYIKVNMGATAPQLVEKLGITQSTVVRILRNLIDQGKIKVVNTSRQKIYKAVVESK